MRQDSKIKSSPDIPPRRTGKQLDLDARTVLPDDDDARAFFKPAKRRLLDVNAAIGTGAKLGLSYPQWKSLIEGLVKQR